MLVKFKNKGEVFNYLNKFYQALNTGFAVRPDLYNSAFTDGDKKTPFVIDFLHRKNANFERLVYISIGGADGAEIIHALQYTKIKYGILLEYSTDFCEKARKSQKALQKDKKLFVESGDVYSNINKVKEILKSLSNDIDGIIITGFSVFHELTYRSVHTDFDFRNLLISLTEGFSEVYFYTKEPCDFNEWKGRTKVSMSKWIKPNELKRFASTIQLKLGNGNTPEFNQPIIQLPDGVEMSSELATEVVKKMVYFLMDKSVYKLMYELEESHAKFSSINFANTIKDIFNVEDKNKFESGVRLKYDSSETFQKLYEEAGVKVKSIENKFLDEVVPMGFFRIEAYYHPIKKKFKVASDYPKGNMFGSSIISLFYEYIASKKFDLAFNLLSPSMREARFNNDLEYFVDGFSNIIDIKLISKFYLQDSELESKSIVHIVKNVSSYTTEGVHNLYDILRVKVKDINFARLESAFKKNIEIIKSLNGNLDKLNEVQLFRLIHPHYIDDLRWIAEIKASSMKGVLEQEDVLLSENNVIICQNINGHWFISRILPVNHNGTYLV